MTTIGPTLGTESLKSGLLAALVGFGLVLLFLPAIYRVLGVVADLALLIYAFLLWGLIVAIPVTVTLPGIAGIVLSIGVAADANVVIFERIKEEIRRGKTAPHRRRDRLPEGLQGDPRRQHHDAHHRLHPVRPLERARSAASRSCSAIGVILTCSPR